MSDTVETSAASSDASSSSSSPSSSASSPTPVDTASIAASVISDIESDSGADSPTTTSSPEIASPDEAPADPDDFDAVDPERIDALGRKRENAIPHSRVKAMIARRERKLIAQVAKELGISKAEAELKLEDVTGALTERNTKFTDYEQKVQLAEQVEAIMDKEPERFVQMLVQTNPAYQQVMAKLFGQAATAAAPAATAASEDDPEPQPDYDLGNGQMTYSLDGMRKRDEWKERQIEKKILSQLDQRLSPMEQERKAAQERQRLEAIHAQAREAITKKLEKASKWPKFTEHETEIAAVINQNPDVSLEDAYMQVVMPKLAAERTSMREELLAEINGQPRSTSVETAPAPSSAPRKKTTADIAKEIMAGMQ